MRKQKVSRLYAENNRDEKQTISRTRVETFRMRKQKVNRLYAENIRDEKQMINKI